MSIQTGNWRYLEEIDYSGGNVTGHWAGLYCDTAGDIVIVTAGGDTCTVAMVAGGILPVEVVQVTQSGSNATVFGGNW